MTGFILFLLFFVGIPAFFVYYTIKKGKEANPRVEEKISEKKWENSALFRIFKPDLFIGLLQNKISQYLLHTYSLEGRHFLRGIIYGASIGVYVVLLLLLLELLMVVLGFVDPSGAGGLVFAEIFIISITTFPWFSILTDYYPDLMKSVYLIVLAATFCIMLNSILLGTTIGLHNLYRAKRPLLDTD